MDSKTLLTMIAKERPVGTPANSALCTSLESQFREMGYETDSLPFDCLIWEGEGAGCTVAGKSFPLTATPYSQGFEGTAPVLVVGTLEELASCDARGKILVLRGELTAEPLQPKDYPFYFPDHHRAIFEGLEQSGCAAFLAVTGQHLMCGLNPFPLIIDGNFAIPSACMSEAEWQEMAGAVQEAGAMGLAIRSRTKPAASRQVVAAKPAKKAAGKILVCAHMDSAYNTPAALDNGAGTAVLMRTAELCRDGDLHSTLEFAPFNSEEYYGYTAELTYLEKGKGGDSEPIRLVVNLDSPCHAGSQIAVAGYSLGGEMEAALQGLVERHPNVVMGEQWYAGDHIPFLQQGVPCITLASADFGEGGLADTHTPRDTVDQVDVGQIDDGAAFLRDFLAAADALL